MSGAQRISHEEFRPASAAHYQHRAAPYPLPLQSRSQAPSSLDAHFLLHESHLTSSSTSYPYYNQSPSLYTPEFDTFNALSQAYYPSSASASYLYSPPPTPETFSSSWSSRASSNFDGLSGQALAGNSGGGAWYADGGREEELTPSTSAFAAPAEDSSETAPTKAYKVMPYRSGVTVRLFRFTPWSDRGADSIVSRSPSQLSSTGCSSTLPTTKVSPSGQRLGTRSSSQQVRPPWSRLPGISLTLARPQRTLPSSSESSPTCSRTRASPRFSASFTSVRPYLVLRHPPHSSLNPPGLDSFERLATGAQNEAQGDFSNSLVHADGNGWRAFQHAYMRRDDPSQLRLLKPKPSKVRSFFFLRRRELTSACNCRHELRRSW